ncbi:MAG: hypothetical protein ABIQ99_18370, partial [Thermoflexales bacterium]
SSCGRSATESEREGTSTASGPVVARCCRRRTTALLVDPTPHIVIPRHHVVPRRHSGIPHLHTVIPRPCTVIPAQAGIHK